MLTSDISPAIAAELHLHTRQTDAAIQLLADGNTVPFIARYRKEMTGSLDEEQLRAVEERLAYLQNLVQRQEEILARIEEQGKLTPELRQAIEKAQKLQELEDLYLPYRQKKRTRAQIARERGLEPLAKIILRQEAPGASPLAVAAAFVDKAKGVPSADAALAGAQDIVAETISEDAKLRQAMRQLLWQSASIATTLETEGDDAERQVFQMYDGYEEPVRTLPPHRILAINRGEKKGLLKVQFKVDHEACIARLKKRSCDPHGAFADLLRQAIEDGWRRLLLPSLEREIRAQLTETAAAQAIKMFGLNLRQLLLQPPLAGHTVLGLDPGYRTGCKAAIIDPTGQVLAHGVIQVTQSDSARDAAARWVLSHIRAHRVTLISIGNGTASRETEEFVAQLIRDHDLHDVHYLITNEAGASVYSASKLAREELPDYDVTIRGAVSIARRVQDPLAELVKIEPKAIGVGQYQHDVNQKELTAALDAVVESAVNHVGVDLNTASGALLKHIAGINATVAKNIVTYRDENGAFTSRRQLLKVPRLGPAAFTQCAGFLRVPEGKSPLDATSVHPESYQLAEQILARLGFTLADLGDKKQLARLADRRQSLDEAQLAGELGAGLPTVHDILDALLRPGRDPREDLPAPLTRQSIVSLSELKPGTLLRGAVVNITDFGAFVDIGLKTSGLIHISEMSHKRVKSPLDVVSVGDILTVMIISVDEQRGRIGLSLKQVPKEEDTALAAR